MAEQHSDVTVAILTFNGAAYLRQILDAVFAQKFDGVIDVLVIDSGSTDGTLEIVADFSEVRLVAIPNSEFGHGKTRNLAAQLARGKFIAYLTHDAVPTSENWLYELLKPFSLDPKTVLVTGKQAPRARCFPLMKYEIQGVFNNMGPDLGTTLFYLDGFAASEAEIAAISFHSDVNGAVRTDFLLHEIPFQDVDYAEDQLLGRDVIMSGHHKAYASRAVVEHSNDLTRREYGMRIFDETVGLRRVGNVRGVVSVSARWRRTARGILGDTLRIARDSDYSFGTKLRWLFVNPWYQVEKWRRYRQATLVDLADMNAIRSHSLENQRKMVHDAVQSKPR